MSVSDSACYIHRTEKGIESRFAMISRRMAQDSNLSFQARGLMLYILSKPPKWKVKCSDLQKQGGIKEKALKTILDELINARYMVRIERRGERGQFNYILEVFEEPELNGKDDEECLTVPPSRGVGGRHTGDGGSDIYSTGARALVPSVDQEIEITGKDYVCVVEKPRPPGSDDAYDEKEPKYAIESLESPKLLETACDIRTYLSQTAPTVDFDKAYRQWWLKRFGQGGIGRRAGAKATLRQYAANLEAWFLSWEEIRKNNGNGARTAPADDYRGPGRDKETPEQYKERIACGKCNGTGTQLTGQGAKLCRHPGYNC